MRILLIHNYYSVWCGEDSVHERQASLLRAAGHEVAVFTRSNATHALTIGGKLRALTSGFGNPFSAHSLGRVADTFHPDIAHVHNFTPMISAAALGELRKRRIPLVMTCHQHRLTCPENHHLRHGQSCMECVGRSGWACVKHRCVNGNLMESAAHAAWRWMAEHAHGLHGLVDRFIVLSSFQADLLRQVGIPEGRIRQLTNFVDPAPLALGAGELVSFIGRCSPEKGIATLTQAARIHPDIPVEITASPEQLAPFSPPANMRPVGFLKGIELENQFTKSRFLVLPSQWHEPCPLVISEAAMRGRPMIATRMGGMPALIQDGETGLLVPARDAGALAAAMRRLWDDKQLVGCMGAAARQYALREFSPTAHLDGLLEVYRGCLLEKGDA